MYYKFYSNCILVKGISRSLISDLQRYKYYLVPNALVDFVQNGVIDAQKVEDALEEEDIPVFKEYLNYLKDKEIIFECDQTLLHNFPALSLEWDYPATISNAIFDGQDRFIWFDEDLLTQLTLLCCNYFELRLYAIADRADLERILDLIRHSQVKCIDLTLKWDPAPDFLEWITVLSDGNPKIRCINIHSSGENRIVRNDGRNFGIILLIKEPVTSEKHCGIISHAAFCINIELFTESRLFNNCLNRKISIDKDGNIKNCPSMPETYGNIRHVTLISALNNSDFKKHWNTTKDQIAICKDCEFRYICTDCRAYLENPADMYSKPLKCGYNPYTCEWQEWSTNPVKQQAIEHYNLSQIITGISK